MRELTSLQKITLAIILITGAVFRFYNYAGWSLSNDELSALNRLHYGNFSEVIEKGSKLNDMHPPGVQAFLYIWTTIFGVSENVLRFPFVLFGIASMYLLFLVAKNWFNVNVALLTTASFATLIFPILYSQLARPYSPGLFFSLFAVYFWTKILFPRNIKRLNIGYYVGFILTGAICMYIHYFTFLFIVIVGIIGVFYTQGKARVIYVISGLLMFLFLIPSISVFLYQVGIGGLGGAGGWLGPPSKNELFLLIAYIFNDSWLLFIFNSIILIYFIYYFLKNKSKNIFRRISALLFLIPFLIAYFYSVFKNPVYQHSIMLFSFPYLLIYIFSFLPDNFSEKKTLPITILILIVTGLSTVAEKKFYSTQYFGVFKELAEKTTEYQNRYGSINVTAVANVIFPYYINYYHEKFNSQMPYVLYNCSSAEQLQKLNKIAMESTASYLSYVWSNTANPEEVEQIISQYYPKVAERINYFNSGVRLFAKAEIKTAGNFFTPSYNDFLDFESPRMNDDTSMVSEIQRHSGQKSILYSADKEFGPTFKKSLNELKFHDNCVIWLKTWIYAEQLPVQASLVLQVNEGGKTVTWRGADVKDYVVTPGKWQPVFLAYKFTDSLKMDAVLSAYVWNSGKSRFFVDDLSITIIPQQISN